MIDSSTVREMTRVYFDAIGSRYLELFKDELEQKPYDRNVLTRFSRDLPPGARVCDVGCGPCGHVTRLLADQGLEILGIDLSPHCIDLARTAEPTLDFRVMDMASLEIRDESLDGIVAYYSILYTPKAHLSDLFAEFRRVLKGNGKVLIVVKEGEGEGFIDDPMGSEYSTYFANFTEVELRGILEQSGFACTFAETREPYDFEFPVRRIYLIAETRIP